VSFYGDYILPHVINLAMRNGELRPYRERVLASAAGRVLEIGAGSGLNLPLYGPRVCEIVALEPSARLIAMAQRQAGQSQAPVSFVTASAEEIPIDSGSIDTVVMTWTLCSIPNAAAALAEIRRVLRPTGELLFVEHGISPDANVRRWQDRLTPVWKRIAGGCHLNRPIRSLVENSGFEIEKLKAGYMNGPTPMTFMYEGRAKLSQSSEGRHSGRELC
jgi:ubiquinone/menaquinone biosynthesis C-methylase UbiE